MSEINEKIRKTFEENGWSIEEVEKRSDGKYGVDIGYYSPLGEDYHNYIIYDGTSEGFVKGFSEAFEYYDAEDHAAEWIAARDRDDVPSSIQALLDDAYDIGEAIDDLEKELCKLDFDEEEEVE